MQAGLALRVEASDPTMRALARDPHRLRDMRDWHTQLSNPPDQQTTAMHRQTSVSVRHEDLRVVATAITTASEVFSSDQRTVTNVPAEYS
jgi:hypothetical protein